MNIIKDIAYSTPYTDESIIWKESINDKEFVGQRFIGQETNEDYYFSNEQLENGIVLGI